MKKKRKKPLFLTLAVSLLTAILVLVFCYAKDPGTVMVAGGLGVPLSFILSLVAVAKWRKKDFTRSFGSSRLPPLKRTPR